MRPMLSPGSPAPRLGALLMLAGTVAACTAARRSRATAPTQSATAGDSAAAVRRTHFYANRPYGTEAQFNPLAVILNNGFDQVRTGPNRRVLEFDYRRGGTGAWHSIIHAPCLVRGYGVRDWTRFELLPLSTKGQGGGQWVPNYQLHLFAGGATYVRLIAWFEQRHMPAPRLSAAATFYAAHVLNEMMENTARTAGSVDAMTDLVIFDPLAVLVWTSERLQRAVGSRVEFTEWSGQPTVGLPGGTIENTFQTTMLRTRLPRTTGWRAFTTMGGSYVGGLSRRVGDSTWWSLGVGGDARTNPVIDSVTGRKTVELLGNVAAFVDRSGSLLASVVLKSGFDAGATMNVYPGVARVGGWSPGFWAQWLRSRELRVGIATQWGIGLGRNP